MNETQAKALNGLGELADKVALELSFAEPGADNGLLPINSFVAAMEETCERYELCAASCEAVAKARALIDEIFLSDAVFSKHTIDLFAAWVPWFHSAMAAIKSGKTAPNFVTAPKLAPLDENALALNLPDDRELLQEFVNESREHLQSIETGVLALEENPADMEMLNAIFRVFHTFKGGSGFLNLTPINKLAHELESLLELARQQKIQINSELIEVILAGGDILKQFIDTIDAQLGGLAALGPIVIPTDEVRTRIANVISAPTHLAPAAFEGQTEFIQRAVAAVDPTQAARNTGSHSTIKVDIEKLDNLIDMVGEMVIAQSLVAQDMELKTNSNQRLARNLAQLARTTKELQRTAMSLRMVPIRATFQKMIRLVRDLSQRAGKEIDLVITGEESELDRNIVEEVADPLIHMIRNSVDHGVEKPEIRRAAGKSDAGKITLAAFHQGGTFVIQIKDDGAGLKREKIVKKAVAQGIIELNAALTDKEIFNLIFAPGFSTAETVTDVSGRGVGMDVVRRNIEQLRGKIEIESVKGQGTTFSIYLPLTLAIIDGLIVRVGEDRYILPTLSVRESFRPTPSMISAVHGKGEIVSVRGRLLPLLRLKQWLSGGVDESDPCAGVIVILESEGAERCILVNELIAKQEVVIKNLGPAFEGNPLLAGAAILSDGRVGLILDVNALVHPRAIPFSKAA